MSKKKDMMPLNITDRDFFQKFFEEYKPFLYHSAASYTSTEADRDDLVQEALIRLMKNISVLRHLNRCKIAYYIVITIRTTYIDMLRQKRDVTFLPLDDEEVIKILYSSALSDRGETTLPARMAVRKLKEALPERDWIVLVGKLLMGYTHEELGKLLGMKPANVRMLLSRAKTKAREALKDVLWIGGE